MDFPSRMMPLILDLTHGGEPGDGDSFIAGVNQPCFRAFVYLPFDIGVQDCPFPGFGTEGKTEDNDRETMRVPNRK